MPTDHAHRVISLRIYPDALQFIADGGKSAKYARASGVWPDLLRLPALFHRPDRPAKPGAAKQRPVRRMPDPLLRLREHLLKHLGGDRIASRRAGGHSVHGLEAVCTVAAELALEVGRPVASNAQNVLQPA